LYRSRKGHGSQ
jgi:hypothetical protein